MKIALENAPARIGRSVSTAFVAHLPIIIVIALFFLASLLLLNSDDQHIEVDGVTLVGKIGFLFSFFLVLCAIIGLIWLIFTPSPDRTVAGVLSNVFRRSWIEIILLRIPIAFGVIYAISFIHLAFKVNIPNFAPYSWDHYFANIDNLIFFGNDPWVISHAIFSDENATLIIDSLYRIWFMVLQFCSYAIIALPFRNRIRLTFLLSYSMNWIVGGALLAILMPAVGPVYMERQFGDPMFQPLMDLLHEQARLVPLAALDVQEWLWDGLTDPNVVPFGVSAFPSLHVEMAATCACLGFGVSRALGWLLTVFTVIILVSSVHLGWHYAIDGFAGAALAVVLWRVSARVTDWWLARTEPRPVGEAVVA